MIKFLLLIALLLSSCSQKYLYINDNKIKIEIADTEAKRTQGLSDRKSLCNDCGMLFIFEKPGNYPFWMKDMKFPLDFIFFRENKIVDIKENILPESYPSSIISTSPFDKVLELNAGLSSKYGFKINSVVKYLP